MSVNIYDASTGTLTRVDKNPVFTGATASAAGAKGVVPAPAAGDEDKYLKGDGSWAEAAADDNYVGTKAAWDQMQASEKEKYKTADFTDDMDGYLIDDVPTSGSQNVVKSGGVYSQINAVSTALTTVESSIAPIQDGTNYSTTYYKGTRFMRGGKLYKVTASSVDASTSINTGAGGNATQIASLANDIINNSSETANKSSKVTGSAIAIRIGNIIQLSFELTPITGETIASNNEVLISGLPAPAITPYTTLITNDGQAISCTISQNGDLKTYYAANAWTAGRMDGTLVYLVGRSYT